MTITIDQPAVGKGAMQATPRRGGTSGLQLLRSLRLHAGLAALVGMVVFGVVLGCAWAQKTHSAASGQDWGLRLLLPAAFPLALLFAAGAAVMAERRDARSRDEIEPQRDAAAPIEPEAQSPADAEWDIPVLGRVPVMAAAGAETQGTVRRGFAGGGALRPVLVEEFAAGEEGLREKMAPELSRRQEAPSAAGEAGMRRTTSWLDRLLGRKAASARIVPDQYGQYDSSADHEPVRAAGVRSGKAARLDPISRQDATSPAWTEKIPTRLQIVPPDEPFEIVVPSNRPLLDAGRAGREIEAPVVPEWVEEPAAAEAVAEPLYAPVENEPQASSPDDSGPRVRPARPLSFQQLTELAQQTSPPIAELVEEKAAMEPEPAIEPQIDLAPPVTPKEEMAPAVRPIAPPQVEDSWVKIRAHKPAAAAEEQVFTEADTHEYPEQYEEDDIEPAYEEASRHLTTGRWDPIPTLRPDSNAWRDRPSPVPPSKPASQGTDRPRWTGVDEEQAGSREASSSGGYRTEPLPEPLLTRQWGLLSKFQQARNSSGDRPVAKTEDEDRSTAKNGDR